MFTAADIGKVANRGYAGARKKEGPAVVPVPESGTFPTAVTSVATRSPTALGENETVSVQLNGQLKLDAAKSDAFGPVMLVPSVKAELVRVVETAKV